MVKPFKKKAIHFWNQVSYFLLPGFCQICGREDQSSQLFSVCKSCLRQELSYFPNFISTRCSVCRTGLDENGECAFCSSRNVFFSSSYFLLEKKDRERELMNRLKFENKKACSSYFSLGLGKIMARLVEFKPDAILPIPSHPDSWKKRPFFATQILLHRLSQKLNIPILNILRKKSKVHQSALNRVDRFFHAKSAFEIKKNARNKMKPRLVLVDDVFTTGASANEIARLLLQNGAESILVVSTTRKTEGMEI